MRMIRRAGSGLGIGAVLLAWAGAASGQAEEAGDLYAVIYDVGPKWRAGVPMEQQGLREHFFYMRDLHARGVILLAGPMGGDGGLVILRATDQAAAERVVADDPAVTAGIFSGRTARFVPRFTSSQPFSAGGGRR